MATSLNTDPTGDAIAKALAGCEVAQAKMLHVDCCKLFIAKEYGDCLVPLKQIEGLESNRQITNLLNREGFKISHGTVDDYIYVSTFWDHIVTALGDHLKKTGYKTAVKLAREKAKLLTYNCPDDGWKEQYGGFHKGDYTIRPDGGMNDKWVLSTLAGEEFRFGTLTEAKQKVIELEMQPAPVPIDIPVTVSNSDIEEAMDTDFNGSVDSADGHVEDAVLKPMEEWCEKDIEGNENGDDRPEENEPNTTSKDRAASETYALEKKNTIKPLILLPIKEEATTATEDAPGRTIVVGRVASVTFDDADLLILTENTGNQIRIQAPDLFNLFCLAISERKTK